MTAISRKASFGKVLSVPPNFRDSVLSEAFVRSDTDEELQQVSSVGFGMTTMN